MKRISLLTLTLCAFLALGCEKKTQGGIPEWPWETPDKPTPEEPKPEEPSKEWTDVTKDYAPLPEYVKILKAPAKLLDRSAVAYIASIDLSKQGFSVWGIDAPDLQGSDEPLQTPSQVWEAQGKPSVIINAGYFYVDKKKS